MSRSSLIHQLINVFPKLHQSRIKGQNGRIGVIGGSFQFTGAPYYSAISGLRVGADLSHIFCSKFSSAAIKSYSPEIITHPLFISEEEVKYGQHEREAALKDWSLKLRAWEKAIHSWVIGPGLGRDQYMNRFFPQLVRGIPNNCLTIFDADAIYYLCQHPNLFQELNRFKTILTPNTRELNFLKKFYRIPTEEMLKQWNPSEEVIELPGNLEYPPFKVIVKGERDLIISRERSFIIGNKGGKKRCGGIGDILAGVVAATALWNFDLGPPLASYIVKEATRRAFQKEGRGMTAPAVIEELSKTVKHIEDSF